MDIHKGTLAFADKYNDGSELGGTAFNLRIGTDADFELVAQRVLAGNGGGYFIKNGLADGFATEFFPSHKIGFNERYGKERYRKRVKGTDKSPLLPTT